MDLNSPDNYLNSNKAIWDRIELRTYSLNVTFGFN